MRAILTYHSIDDSGSPISISPAAFRSHVDWLAGGAVRVEPLERLLAADAATKRAGGDAVAVTFDDALVNFAERAWPLLAERRLPVTLFVPTDHVGGRNDWAPGPGGATGAPAVPALDLLDWPALRRLAREGLELGSHGRRHVDLRRLGDDALSEEIAGSARVLEAETGRRPATFAYPYGAFDRRIATAAKDTYRLACTTELRALAAEDEPHLLPRLDAYYLRRPGALEAWGTRRFARHLALRRLARRGRARWRAWTSRSPDDVDGGRR